MTTPLKGPPELDVARADLAGRQPSPVEPDVDVWPDGTAGWRCGGCGRYAGPYGTEETARRQADWHRYSCAKLSGGDSSP